VEHTDLRRLLLIGTVSALSLTALFALFALLVGRFDETQVRILATTGGFGLASLLAMPGTRLLEQDRDVALGQLVVFMATATFVLEFWTVWIATESNLSWRALVVAVSLTTAAAQIASSLARRRAPRIRRRSGCSAWRPRCSRSCSRSSSRTRRSRRSTRAAITGSLPRWPSSTCCSSLFRPPCGGSAPRRRPWSPRARA